MKIERKEYYSKGIKMNYYVFGNGKPILFLHGGVVNGLTYKKSLELLAKKHLIIAPDIPCFGKSDTPNQHWDFDDFARFFSNFIDSVSYDDLLLIGQSFGGGIALNLASVNNKVSRLILIDSAGICPQYSSKKFFYFLAKKSLKGFFVNPLIETRMLKDFLFELIKRFSSVFFIYKLIEKAIFKNSIPDSIKCPVNILWGINDELFDERYAKKLNAKLKKSKLEFVKGNHDWCLLKPKIFAQMINKIIDQNKTA